MSKKAMRWTLVLAVLCSLAAVPTKVDLLRAVDGSGPLVSVSSCAAGECVPKDKWICNVGNGDKKNECDNSNCELFE